MNVLKAWSARAEHLRCAQAQKAWLRLEKHQTSDSDLRDLACGVEQDDTGSTERCR